jgi:alpha-beta hydrolase superfamily lysophospholipase
MMRPLVLALSILALAACAPIVQQAGRPPTGFQGARIEADRFVSFDGTRLGLSVWKAQGVSEPKVVIIGLHGMNDYAGAFRTAARYWAADGITTYAYDQRGYGRSPRRGIWAGEDLMDEDLRTFAMLVRRRHPHATIAVVGESMGSAVAITAFASDRPPDADRLILCAPAVWGWSSQPLPQRVSAWIAGHTVRSWSVEPPRFIAERIQPTDNLELWARILRDPLMLWDTRFDAIYGIVDLMEDAWKWTGRIEVPTAYLYGQRDQAIPPKPAFEAAARLKPTDRTAWYARGYHLLLIDHQARNVWRDVEAFIADPSAPLPSGAPPMPRPGSHLAKLAEKRSDRKENPETPATAAAASPPGDRASRDLAD